MVTWISLKYNPKCNYPSGWGYCDAAPLGGYDIAPRAMPRGGVIGIPPRWGYCLTAFIALITTAGVPCPGKEVSPIIA